MSKLARITALLLGLTLTLQAQAQTWGCSATGGLGGEALYGEARSAVLNPQGDFSSDAARNIFYAELDSRCFMARSEVRLKLLGEHIRALGGDGLIQRGQEDVSRGMVREGYMSLRPLESFFVDIGKKDIRNGQLFFVSPLDVLQNPVDYSSLGYINARGIAWRDAYREGSMLIQGTWFGSPGNVELAVLPKLANIPGGIRVTDMKTLQRTNSSERFYVSYSASQFEDFNPKLVAVLGTETRIGLGISGFINEDLIFSAEAAVHSASDIKKLDARQIDHFMSGDYPSAYEVFEPQERDTYGQMALGLRHTTERGLDISIEYLFQEQGYTDKDWENYFDFLELSERAYRLSAVQAFRGYALIAAGEADDLSRRDTMMGRSYVMAHLRRGPQSTRGVGWESAAIYNVDDESYSLNLHLFSQVHRHLQVYVGGGYAGGAQKSEFGRFGSDGVGYAGVRAIW